MEKTSFDYVWELINPSPDYNNVRGTCRGYWNALTLERQRLIYKTLREEKRQGVRFKDNPLFVLQDCRPTPTNWNGRPGINEKVKSGEKMVIARYEGYYGTYTLQEAELFGMTDIQPMNY